MLIFNKLYCLKRHMCLCVNKLNPKINNFSSYTPQCNIVVHNHRFYSTYYNKIDDKASKLCEKLDSNHVIGILKDYTASNYNTEVIDKLFPKDFPDIKNDINIHKYLLFLQVCNKFKIKELDLVSSLSVTLTNLFSKLSLDTEGGGFSELKSITLAMCRIYNDLKLLYDPLFFVISNRFSNCLEEFSWEELSLLIRTYSRQRYNEAEIVKNICNHIENNNLDNLDPNSAVSMYSSFAHLEYLSLTVKSKLENVFMECGDKLNTFNPTLTSESLLNIAYSNLLLDTPSINDMKIVLSCLLGISSMYKSEELSQNFLRNFTVVVSYMKCLYRDLYETLEDVTKKKIMTILMKFNEHKKFETTIFVEKVSEHLRRMRIGCDVNVYKNGVLLDIVEQDQNLVWLCNSYHRFYATTFNMTANNKLLTKLIKAFGYKVAIINYYQWGRMKCKRTRFAFLRMARYYALKDKREFDPKYSGWSLPYIWWNYTSKDRLHISHYDHYNP